MPLENNHASEEEGKTEVMVEYPKERRRVWWQQSIISTQYLFRRNNTCV